MRIAGAVAGCLAIAAAGMAAVAFTAGDGDGRPTTATASPTPARERAHDGLAVWVAQGCGGCHTLAAANAHADIGPDLASSLKGMPASYVKESIVAPSAHAAAGYATGMMPEDYAARIAPGDLDRLVRFLLASARR